MRMMLTASLPNEPFNSLVRSGNRMRRFGTAVCDIMGATQNNAAIAARKYTLREFNKRISPRQE